VNNYRWADDQAMEKRPLMPHEAPSPEQEATVPQHEQPAAVFGKQFYKELTKRPDIRELLKRLAQE